MHINNFPIGKILSNLVALEVLGSRCGSAEGMCMKKTKNQKIFPNLTRSPFYKKNHILWSKAELDFKLISNMSILNFRVGANFLPYTNLNGPILGSLFPKVKVRYILHNFDKKWAWPSFGRLFNKLIQSPCLAPASETMLESGSKLVSWDRNWIQALNRRRGSQRHIFSSKSKWPTIEMSTSNQGCQMVSNRNLNWGIFWALECIVLICFMVNWNILRPLGIHIL
jgi:hypothetical protein